MKYINTVHYLSPKLSFFFSKLIVTSINNESFPILIIVMIYPNLGIHVDLSYIKSYNCSTEVETEFPLSIT